MTIDNIVDSSREIKAVPHFAGEFSEIASSHQRIDRRLGGGIRDPECLGHTSSRNKRRAEKQIRGVDYIATRLFVEKFVAHLCL